MKKIQIMLTLAAIALIGALSAPRANAAVDISALQPFTPQANFMSLPGYVRYQTLITEGRWMTREEAEEIVRAAGKPTGTMG
jgi:hypothetical protein